MNPQTLKALLEYIDAKVENEFHSRGIFYDKEGETFKHETVRLGIALENLEKLWGIS